MGCRLKNRAKHSGCFDVTRVYARQWDLRQINTSRRFGLLARYEMLRLSPFGHPKVERAFFCGSQAHMLHTCSVSALQAKHWRRWSSEVSPSVLAAALA